MSPFSSNPDNLSVGSKFVLSFSGLKKSAITEIYKFTQKYRKYL